MAGNRQHYLPAAILAGFATTPATRLRETRLWAARRGVAKPWNPKVEDIALADRLYTLDKSGADAPAAWAHLPATFLDDIFTKSEARHPEAIDHLLNDKAPRIGFACGHRFINALVVHVSLRFTRGIEVERREQNRAKQVGLPPPSKATVLYARVNDALWTAGAVLRSQWTVVRVPPGHHLVVNDLGRFPIDTPWGKLGWAIPLRRDALLVIDPKDRENLPGLHEAGDGWLAGPIFHTQMSVDRLREFNELSAKHALHEAYCDDLRELQRVQAHMDVGPPHPEASELFALTRTSKSPQAAIRAYFHAWLALTVPPSAYPGMTGGFGAFPVFDLPDSVSKLLEFYDQHLTPQALGQESMPNRRTASGTPARP